MIVRAALAAAILGFAPGVLEPFTPLKAAIIRGLGIALLVSHAIRWLATLGFSRPRLTPATLAVAAWIVAALLSWITHPPLHLGLYGEIEQREGVLTLLGLAGLWAAARHVHPTRADVRRTLDVMVVCTALAGAYALVQLAGHDPLPWGNTIEYATGEARVVRPWGTLGNAILLGAMGAAALAAATARLTAGRADPWRWIPGVALLSATVAVTLSRGAWLAAAAGTAVALAGAALVHSDRARMRWIVTGALAAMVPAVALFASILRGPVAARLIETSHRELGSLGARIEIARSTFALWRSHPLLGVGPDGFGLAFPRVQTAALWREEWLGQPVHAHSVVLQILATLGLAGLLAAAAWLAVTVLALVKRWRTEPEMRAEQVAIAAILVALAIAGAFNAIGLAAAVVFAIVSGIATADPAQTSTSGPARRTAAVAGLAIVMWAMLDSAGELQALQLAGRSREGLLQAVAAPAEAQGALLDGARANAGLAAIRARSEDELWRIACDASLARCELALGRQEGAPYAARGAEEAARRAVELEPRRASNVERVANAFAMQARIAARDGDPEASAFARAADSTYAAALDLAPTNAMVMTQRARSALLLGESKRALEIAREISSMYPDAAQGHALQAAALLTLGRSGEARAALRRAANGNWGEQAPERSAVEAMLLALDRADSLERAAGRDRR